MRVALCVKQVPTDDKVAVDPVTHKLLRESSVSDINPCDLNAMEMARQFKEQTDVSIDVYTMGPDMAQAALKKCLALGADRAFLLNDRKFAGGDTLGTAKVLAAALKLNGPYDIVLTGNESSDGSTGQVGPMLAESLKIPDIAETMKASVKQDNTLVINRKLGSGNAILLVNMPVLLTVPFGCNTPAKPTLELKVKANKVPITVFTQQELRLSEEEIGLGAALSVVTNIFPVSRNKKAEQLDGTKQELAHKLTELIKQGRD